MFAQTVCHFEAAANAAKGGWKGRYESLHNKPPQPWALFGTTGKCPSCFWLRVEPP
jgi:hypothetical protein